VTVLGEYGGKVVRALETGGRTLLPGAVFTPEMAAPLPVPTRAVLARTGFVEWFNQPIPGSPQAQQEAAAPGRRK
jgi:hypothetical protein